jgi:YHS domain-containing protein
MKRRRLILNACLTVAAMAIPAFGQASKAGSLRKSVPFPKTTFSPKSAPQPRPEKVRDPVCGLMVDKDPELSAVYKGQTYYFCSKADRDKFTNNPEKYVGSVKLK